MAQEYEFTALSYTLVYYIAKPNKVRRIFSIVLKYYGKGHIFWHPHIGTKLFRTW